MVQESLIATFVGYDQTGTAPIPTIDPTSGTIQYTGVDWGPGVNGEIVNVVGNGSICPANDIVTCDTVMPFSSLVWGPNSITATWSNLLDWDPGEFVALIFTVEARHFPAPEPAPEPTTLSLFALGLLAMRRRITA